MPETSTLRPLCFVSMSVVPSVTIEGMERIVIDTVAAGAVLSNDLPHRAVRRRDLRPGGSALGRYGNGRQRDQRHQGKQQRGCRTFPLH